ncbi:MAG TPA: sterol desaturase family protein [Methylomirabilota bacterium]|nr:sterol desaturase family protein [Methylomirabilota bacterium]
MKTPFITIAILATLFILERLFPLRPATRALVGRLVVNLTLSLLTFGVAMLLVRPAALQALDWSAAKPFGLLHLVAMPEWARWVAAFLLLDVAFYYWHVLNHRVPFLWRFHNVHHFDPDLDVSTGFRFHFGEVAFSTVFRVVQVALIGVSLPQFAAYEIVFQAGTLFHHSNWHLPRALEKALNFIIVTPRMHGIHHSQFRDETNSNYSVVFSFWDRLHRTLRLGVAQNEITVGVPGYSSMNDNRILSSLTAPFRRQRLYWTKSTQSRREAETQRNQAPLRL